MDMEISKHTAPVMVTQDTSDVVTYKWIIARIVDMKPINK